MKRIHLFFFAIQIAVVSVHAQTLRIATYNVRYDNPNDAPNTWTSRLPVITQLVQFHDFDMFGGQELMFHQLEGLAGNLPGYAWFGLGREDGEKKGEFSPVFYKTDKFKMVRNGTFWLSPTPEKPSQGWDAALRRVCSWGEFVEKESKLKFFCFNTHFDHVGVQARVESAKLILEQIKKIAGDAPVILMGDFNFDQNSEGFQVLNASNLEDSYSSAAIRMAGNGTFNSFNINTQSDRRIDHIFVSKHFEVQRYGILTDSYQAKFPSDHFPVLVVIQAKKGKQ